jgi:DNA-binding PadR family transcriptional regulator
MGWPFRVTDPLLDVLEVFIGSDEELHGWEIISRAHRTGATVYQVLERLRKARWVDHRWEDFPVESSEGHENVPDDRQGGHRPRRRYYRLSGEGAAKAPVLLRERRPEPGQRLVPGLVFHGRLRGAH